MRPLGDLKWTLPPLTGFLFALGGWAIKAIRRLGIPLAVGIYAWLYSPKNARSALAILSAMFCLWGALTLPLTLVGDKMTAMNFIWAFGLGAITIFSIFPLCFIYHNWVQRIENLVYWVALGSLLYGASIIASNTFNWFQHKWTETLLGLLIGGASADTIGEREA